MDTQESTQQNSSTQERTAMQNYRELTGRAHAELVGRASLLTQGQRHCAEAVRLIEEGRVEQTSTEPTVWHVIGRSSNEMYPIMGDRCPCRTKRSPSDPKGYNCAHLIAVKLYRWVEETMTREGHPMHTDDVVNTVTGEIASETLQDDQEGREQNHTSAATKIETKTCSEPVGDATSPVCEASPGLPIRWPSLRQGLRPLAAILADLHRPLPNDCVGTKPATSKGGTISFLHWPTVARVLDQYAPGWEGRVVRIDKIGEKCAITYQLTIHAAEGAFTKEDIGMEDEDGVDSDGKEINPYGDAATNALATAFKRAAAKFGVGLWLYEKSNVAQALRRHFEADVLQAWRVLGTRLDQRQIPRDEAIRWLYRETGVSAKRDVPLAAVQALAAQFAQDEEL